MKDLFENVDMNNIFSFLKEIINVNMTSTTQYSLKKTLAEDLHFALKWNIKLLFQKLTT